MKAAASTVNSFNFNARFAIPSRQHKKELFKLVNFDPVLS
jgi:hypothetical protein